MFKVGQKVVCVNGRYRFDRGSYFDFIKYKWKFPVCGQIYTVRKVFEATILVEELVNHIIIENGREPEFYFWRFRALDDLLDEINLEEHLTETIEEEVEM